MKVSQRTLMIIAAVIWYAGGLALLLKGGALINKAYGIDPQSNWALIASVVGVIAGLLKAGFLFGKSCKKNITRINSLPNPRIWQCFRPGMLIFLAVIIPTGAWMSRVAAENYTLLCLVGGLDLSISIALLTSSLVFWKLKAFSN